MRFTYAPATTETILKGASRISARIVPKMMPPVIDNSVSVTVKVIPSLNR